RGMPGYALVDYHSNGGVNEFHGFGPGGKNEVVFPVQRHRNYEMPGRNLSKRTGRLSRAVHETFPRRLETHERPRPRSEGVVAGISAKRHDTRTRMESKPRRRGRANPEWRAREHRQMPGLRRNDKGQMPRLQ